MFSLIHFDPIGFLPRFILGIAFGLLWLDSGSLWAGIFAHALNNGVSSVVFLWFSPDSGSDVNSPQNQWLAGALACGGGISLTIFLWLLARRKPGEPPLEPLPSEDPAALALPNPGGVLATAELRGWVRTYLASAAVGLMFVGVAALIQKGR